MFVDTAHARPNSKDGRVCTNHSSRECGFEHNKKRSADTRLAHGIAFFIFEPIRPQLLGPAVVIRASRRFSSCKSYRQCTRASYSGGLSVVRSGPRIASHPRSRATGLMCLDFSPFGVFQAITSKARIRRRPTFALVDPILPSWVSPSMQFAQRLTLCLVGP
ncbi:hypothetical protein VTK73DRAFT_4668 [Phialemonium thermophilum]|uniref:Uncharacterized protein n=1 Tax=Phialemonium thermophilum TaxID=223376 RepID=A0ABR3WSZ7_9PEZI